MGNSKNFDISANTFEDLVTEEFTNFTKIGSSENKRKLNSQNNILKPKTMRLSVIHDILPPEILDNIFKFLNYKEICQAQLICRKWKEIIENGNLLKKASGRILFKKRQNQLWVYSPAQYSQVL